MALYQSGTGLTAMVGIGTTNPTSNLNVIGNVYATNNIITSSSFYGILAGSNTISATVITASSNVNAPTINATTSNTSTLVATTSISATAIATTGFYGPVIGSNVIGATVITASSNVNAPTINAVTSNSATVIATTGFYGNIAGSNSISCTSITSTSGTIQTSYAQGVNSPATGQAYFYNPTNAVSQDASCGVRLAGATARYAYYSYDVSGVAGFSHGILGSSQNLVFRASWDMSTATLYTMDRSGNFTATGSIAANSDSRLKSNIEPITDAIEKVKKITGYTFTRNDIETKPRQAGVIAQEMLEVLPEVVNKDDNGMYTVAYGNITALLIQALKEEKKKREALEERILKLENNIAHQ